MSYEDIGTLGASAADAVAAVHGQLQGVGVGSREGDCSGPGSCGSARKAQGCDARPGKLSYYTLRAVETSAEAAARDNRTPLEACPYRMDFAPAEMKHWLAVYVLNGGTL